MELLKLLDFLEGETPETLEMLPSLTMSADDLQSVMDDWSWTGYDLPADSGSGQAGVRGANSNGSPMLSLVDGDWHIVYQLYAFFPAVFSNTPEGVNDGLRDGSHSTMIKPPHQRVWEFSFKRIDGGKQ